VLSGDVVLGGPSSPGPVGSGRDRRVEPEIQIATTHRRIDERGAVPFVASEELQRLRRLFPRRERGVDRKN
jgi:hypothetical protein